MVSRNTTLVPSVGLRIGPACEAGLSAGMQRERVPPQIRKKERERKKCPTVVIEFFHHTVFLRYKQCNHYSSWNDLQTSLKVICTGTIQQDTYKFLLVVCILTVYRLRYSTSNNGVPLKSGLGVTHSANVCMICTSLTSNQPTRSTQRSTLRGTVKWVSAFGLSNNDKWRWWV